VNPGKPGVFTPDENYRASTAPWIPIGRFQKGLLTHLSLVDIFRALAVLRICSFDIFVDNSMKVNFVQNLNPINNQRMHHKLFMFDLPVHAKTTTIQLFRWSQKFGNLGEWMVRSTFFNQFVGGDSYFKMAQTVQALQTRNLTLMVAPVLEEDIHDQVSSR